MTKKLPEGFPNARTYYGMTIRRCGWADNPHGGEWLVQTYHQTGTPWDDEQCAHYRTLAEAKSEIRFAASFQPLKADGQEKGHDCNDFVCHGMYQRDNGGTNDYYYCGQCDAILQVG